MRSLDAEASAQFWAKQLEQALKRKERNERRRELSAKARNKFRRKRVNERAD